MWSMKFDNNKFGSQKVKNHQMLPSEIVNPNITLLYLQGFRAYKSPVYFMWTTIKFTKKLSVNCEL